MISVIIVTKNKNYAVLDVPTNGRLVIMEQHLICGIVQNGVKMIPYGNILFPFETFIFDNTMSVEMIPAGVWRPEGRILDFSTIELLQSSETIHPSKSGSTETFTAPIFTEGGYPVVYNLMVRGLNLTISTAKAIFTGYNKLAFDCNAVSDIGDGYQKLSLINPTGVLKLDIRDNAQITEFYDIGGIIKTTSSYTFDGLTNVKIIDLPALTTWSGFTIYQKPPNALKLLKVPVLPFFGSTAGLDALQIGGGFNKIPVGVQFEVPRSMETVNAGALEGDLQGLINANKTPNIVYID